MSLDFANEGVFATNRAHILDLVTLARRDEAINTFQKWREKALANSSEEEKYKYKLLGSISGLFTEVEQELKRALTTKEDRDGEEFLLLKQKIIYEGHDLTDEQIILILTQINKVLDGMNLTRRDKKPKLHNAASAEERNKLGGVY